MQLVNSKCIPALLYGLEACPLNKTDLRSLDFSVNSLLMKLFKTNDLQTIMECQSYFGFQLPSVRLSHRSKRFDDKYSAIHLFIFITVAIIQRNKYTMNK